MGQPRGGQATARADAETRRRIVLAGEAGEADARTERLEADLADALAALQRLRESPELQEKVDAILRTVKRP